MNIFTTGYSASTLVASATAGAQTTFESIGPILAVVAGVILAMVLARYVLSLFKQVGKK